MKDLHKIASEVICPICKKQLSFNPIKSIYQCIKNHEWEILSGIPRLVDSKNNYSSAFGLQWEKYRKTQLDSYSNTSISRQRLTNAFDSLKRFGSKMLQGLLRFFGIEVQNVSIGGDVTQYLYGI